MPRSKKPPIHRPVLDDYPDPTDLDPQILDEEPDQTRSSRKKNRNAYPSPPRVESPFSHSGVDESLREADSLSPPRQSLLSQISFPGPTKSKPVNIREDVTTEKVSDQYTPPSDGGLPDHGYEKSPNTDSIAVSSPTNTPPVEPAFAKRHSLQARGIRTSPALRHARPVSFGSGAPPTPSMYGRPQSSLFGSPPAPHLPQPHFYAAQDIDLGIQNRQQNQSIEEPVFTKFIQLPGIESDRKRGVVLGYCGRINVCMYSGDSIEEIGAITGISGEVEDAELLSWTSGVDPYATLRPLLAVTSVKAEQLELGRTIYRTTVQVYSLAQQKRILDLLIAITEASPIIIPALGNSQAKPSQSLRLKASGNYLVVSSGKSGEVFTFCPVSDGSMPTFECLAKVWTSIQALPQRRDSSHHRSSDTHRTGSRTVKSQADVPILSCSGRWLAVCPPGNTASSSIDAVLGPGVLVGRSAGFESRSAGARPSVNCDVDSPDIDSLFGKVARGMAQEMVKGAKWLGDQGVQAWQSYWKKEDLTAESSADLRSQYGNMPYMQPGYGQFPPTHAANMQAKEPEIVCVYDLKTLHDLQTRKTVIVTPFATFQPPNGCSFLSFSPDSLMLLTASRKGDYQYVWNLLEMKHRRNTPTTTDEESSRFATRVRQIARFDRMSSSVIVDVIWDKPMTTRLALLTKNKTVHLFDLPASVLKWPPSRTARKSRPISAPPNGSATFEQPAPPLGGFFTSAMTLAGKTQPILSNWRGRAPSTSGGFSGLSSAGLGIAAATGARGSKAVASGLSKSLGAASDTVSRLQHAGENRLSLKTDKDMASDQICWFHRASKSGICVLGESSVKFYQVRKTRAQDQKQQRPATVFDARRAVNSKIPPVTIAIHLDTELPETQGFWTLRPEHVANASKTHPLSFAEIDTNAPYQPFHSDRRITLSVFESQSESAIYHGHSPSARPKEEEQWVFGEPLTATQLNIRPLQTMADDDGFDSVIYRESSVTTDNVGESEHIVSTTRRKKSKRGARSQVIDQDDATQEGFFEDDCDVLDFATDRV